MKQRLSKKDQKSHTKKNKSGRSWQSWVLNSVGLLFLFGVVVFRFLPYGSMHFQNNEAASLNTQDQRVMFYSAKCSDCARVYPKVFWHNVVNFGDPSKQVETINLDAPLNKHFIADEGLIATPTFMNLKSNTTAIITNNKDVSDYLSSIKN